MKCKWCGTEVDVDAHEVHFSSVCVSKICERPLHFTDAERSAWNAAVDRMRTLLLLTEERCIESRDPGVHVVSGIEATVSQMRMNSPAFEVYLTLERRMLYLESHDHHDAADRVRDAMDPAWHALTDEERAELDARRPPVRRERFRGSRGARTSVDDDPF